MSCRFSLDEVVEVLGGSALNVEQKSFEGIGTDTRQSLKGNLFVALKGESHDAHEFLAEAVHQGASGLLVHSDEAKVREQLGKLFDQITVIKVPDTLKGLQKLGLYWRNKIGAQVVAISGSNGKTTTKDFCSQILATQFSVSASPGSFNNHWGVPLSLLAASEKTEVLVVEMGMNHQGELTELCHMALPDLVLITNVGRAHVGELGSIEAVAKAKQELYDCASEAIQVFNIDNGPTIQMYEQAKKRNQARQILTFSSHRPQADVYLRAIHVGLDHLEVQGSIAGVEGEARLSVFGRQNVNNVMGACAVALGVGLTPEKIWRAIPQCHTGWGRNQLVRLGQGTQVLFDAYNANPESMAALIKNIYEMPLKGKKYAVLGEMLEMGAQREEVHKELGELIGRTDFDGIWFLGESAASFEAGVRSAGFEKNLYLSMTYEESLAKKMGSVLDSADIVVIKGSRGMRLERVLKTWSPVNFN